MSDLLYEECCVLLGAVPVPGPPDTGAGLGADQRGQHHLQHGAGDRGAARSQARARGHRGGQDQLRVEEVQTIL